MKAWPEDGSTVDFEDLCDRVCDAIRIAYEMKRRNEDKDIPYDGYDIGKREKLCSLSPSESLTAEALVEELEGQGRDALTRLVSLAVQLGIEQGRRLATERILDVEFMFDAALLMPNDAPERLKMIETFKKRLRG